MSLIESLAVSGYVGKAIIVPVLRVIASILFAVAISKDCKSRTNASSTLWGILTLIFPVLFGIIYFVYSRFFIEKSPDSYVDKKLSKSSKIYFSLAVIFYAAMVTSFVIFSVVAVSSSISDMIA